MPHHDFCKRSIKPGVNLQKEDPDLITVVNLPKQVLKERWLSPEGKYILQTWKAQGFSRTVLEELVGKYYDHIDLRGIPLQDENLEGKDLRSIDFFAANLQGANFRKSDLRDSWLSEADIRGASFDWAKMDNVLLDGVEFDSNTSFVGVNLNTINFTLAALLQDLALNQQRIVHLQQKQPILAWFLRVTSDYGRSLLRYMVWCLGIVLLFGVFYRLFWHLGWWEALYVSLMLFLTIGIESSKPSSITIQGLFVIESIIGYLMMGLLIAIFVRKTIGD